MGKYTSRTNNELLVMLHEMDKSYESLKQEILVQLDKLESIEKDYAEAEEEIRLRLLNNKGE